jgi:predicted nucleotidyltransferase
MNFDVDKRTILLTKSGSHAYGTNVEGSDEDFKGVCIKPREAYFGFTQKFEQMEHMGSKSDGIDKVIYSLDKFASLAADCNPNIIEVLHIDEKHILKLDEFGHTLRSHKDEFLSKKAKFTFSGYAQAQLHRIKTHRAWLLNPPKAAPERKDFGLSESVKVSKSELGAFNSLVDQGHSLEGLDAFVSDETFWQRLSTGARYVFGRQVSPSDVVTLFTREKAYQAAKTHFDQYLNWVKTRNPKRAETEAKYGYDTKHGMHLWRLETMGVEILRDHKVYVDRTNIDRDKLMSIRHGEVEYDELVEGAERLEALCAELYKTSTLRKEPNRVKIDDIVVNMTYAYLSKHG